VLRAVSTPQDLQRVIKHFDTDGDGEITYQEFLKGLAGKLNKRRQAMVDMAFEVMDTDKSGVIDAADVKDRYDASHHPKVISGEKTKEQVLKEFLMTMEGDHGNMDGEITREEWNDYYTGISASIMYNDDYFCMMMEKVWGIKESPNNAISEEEVKRLKAIIKEKAHQKAKGNTSERITAMQTFKHFDTDNSGEINFAEFSQALERFGVVMDKGKATALFGAFDKAGKGKISYQEFVNALYAEEAALEEARLKALKAAAPAPAKK
jgi:Ca2+-binding EF-hand superfamily protein